MGGGGGGDTGFAPELNEKELLENATPGSIEKASKYSMKIFQVKNNLSIRVSHSKTILGTIYRFKNDLYSVTSSTSHKMKLRRLVKYLWGVFNKTIIPLALVGYEMIIANLALRASLSIFHLISNALSRNN